MLNRSAVVAIGVSRGERGSDNGIRWILTFCSPPTLSHGDRGWRDKKMSLTPIPSGRCGHGTLMVVDLADCGYMARCPSCTSKGHVVRTARAVVPRSLRWRVDHA